MQSIGSSYAFDNTQNNRFRLVPAGAAALCLLLLLAAPQAALAAPYPMTRAPAGAPACPLATPTMKASLDAKAYTGRVGSTTHIRVRLSPPAAPEGFFVTTIIEVVSGPAGPAPAILTGVPESDITPRAPGDYRLRLLVSLIAKSSCGGVKSATLLDREVTLTVR